MSGMGWWGGKRVEVGREGSRREKGNRGDGSKRKKVKKQIKKYR